MSTQQVEVIAGVDTHGRTHHGAVIDALGRPLGDREFPATAAGYAQLETWVQSFGQLMRVGVEGTGSYGVGLTRHLHEHGIMVGEVNRPDRASRRRTGKSDPLDAYAAARAALVDTATVTPKERTGSVESIRVLRLTRSGAVKARTQALNQVKALLVTAPAGLREKFSALSTTALISACTRLRPGDITDPAAATKLALRRLATRAMTLTREIKDADRDLRALTTAAAPALLALNGVGSEVAAALLIAAGDNPERITTEAAFAHLCGVAPIPASSGRTHRHRLNRGGNRDANKALYVITLNRLRYDARTRAYADRRTREGLSKREIIRCLKRYVAREIFHILQPQHTT